VAKSLCFHRDSRIPCNFLTPALCFQGHSRFICSRKILSELLPTVKSLAAAKNVLPWLARQAGTNPPLSSQRHSRKKRLISFVSMQIPASWASFPQPSFVFNHIPALFVQKRNLSHLPPPPRIDVGDPYATMLAHLRELVKQEITRSREGRENVALPPDLGKGFERAKKSRACHPERSEGSPQFFVSRWNKSNCGDPSLRSG
jgi:hypothetical protein